MYTHTPLLQHILRSSIVDVLARVTKELSGLATSFATNMPLALEEPPEQLYFIAILIIGEKYNIFGYSGSMSLVDLSYLIMNLAGGHVVALPGASVNCFFIGTTAAWISLCAKLSAWTDIQQ